MNQNGWICLHRKVLNNPTVTKNHDAFFLWVWLLLNAAHDETVAYFNGERVDLMPGQLVISYPYLAEKTGLTVQQARNLISNMQNDRLINRQITNKFTVISIVSWDKYQNPNRQTNRQTNRRTTGKPTGLLLNKQINNKNNITREAAKAEFSVPAHDDSAALLALLQNLTEEE